MMQKYSNTDGKSEKAKLCGGINQFTSERKTIFY